MKQALDESWGDHPYSLEVLRSSIRHTFLWDYPEEHHLHLSSPLLWWDHTERHLAASFQSLGISQKEAQGLAEKTHQYYIDPSRYTVFDDTFPVLKMLQKEGWRQIILSNHVPELPEIVQSLGFGEYISDCITSAVVGYEKPHPLIFKMALTIAGNPAKSWMVGDNPEADVAGACQAGIPSILVRSPDRGQARFFTANLWGVLEIVSKKKAKYAL